MAFILDDRVRESSTTTGTGAIALGGAPGGHQAFSAVMSIGDTCWYSIVLPGSAWETGLGTYSALNTLTRTTVISSSNSGALVNFSAGTKDVFITQPAKKAQPFPSGTLMLFQQTTAPTFWTKQTTHNDKALRVVSGTAGSGGTNAFSTVNGAAAAFVNGHQLTVAEMPSHTHSDPVVGFGSVSGVGTGAVLALGNAISGNTGSTGGDGPHSHTLNMAIQYVDLIICSKD
jgi:hypothetical protein